MQYLSAFDIFLPPFYILFLAFFSGFVRMRHQKEYPEYRYFQKALFVKVAGGIGFGLIYVFYYGGGDTTNYYESAIAYSNLALKDPGTFLDLLLHPHEDHEAQFFFDQHTGYPIYRITDHAATFTTLFYVPVTMLGGYSFFATTILAATLSFTGLWKLYRVFVSVFPDLKKELFISIFCVPSVFFWGSGIMKDSITIGAIGWYVYSFYWFFIRRKWKWYYLLYLFISAYLLISIKPYILFALLPGSIIWLSNQISSKFQNRLLRVMFTPVFLTVGIAGAFFALNQVDDMLGLYKLDTVVERASIVNKDLKMDYYGGNSFDIGDYDPSIQGMLSVAHKAIFAALFRPSILDARNFVMILSALENTYILILTIVLLFQLRVIGFFRFIWKHPLLLFSVLFSLFFAFSVGISISNFGSMVRLRIPSLPFFVSALFIIRHLYEKKYNIKIRI